MTIPHMITADKLPISVKTKALDVIIEFLPDGWNDVGICPHCGKEVRHDNKGSNPSDYWFHSEDTDGRNGLYCSPEWWENGKRDHAPNCTPELASAVYTLNIWGKSNVYVLAEKY